MNKVFSPDFWGNVIEKSQNWLIAEFPGIVILTLIIFIVLRVLIFSLNKLQKRFIKHAEKNDDVNTRETEKRLDTLFGILKGALKIVLFFVLVVIIMKKVGVEIGPILASAGVLGLAIGFGAQELVRDYITGFFMLLENQVRTGDVAIINGQGGLVEKIELRTITLRDFSQTVHIFRNGKIDTISNMTKDWSAMVFDIGVAYKEDVDKVIEIMKKVGDELCEDPNFKNLILEPMEVFGLDQFGDSAIVIKGRIKTKPIEQWTVGREYRKRLKYSFDKQNIEIPFPHTTVYWGEEINPLKLNVEGK